MADTYNIGPTVPGLFRAHEERYREAQAEIERLKHLWYTDADPEKTEYADDYYARVDERGGVILPASKENKS
jgi:alkanesulfonate monooxygenase SsuD/methylene tetrahydromethanopterin reductase-like flavin-dependent oxidoreductase (luciferase family)